MSTEQPQLIAQGSVQREAGCPDAALAAFVRAFGGNPTIKTKIEALACLPGRTLSTHPRVFNTHDAWTNLTTKAKDSHTRQLVQPCTLVDEFLGYWLTAVCMRLHL